MEGRSEHVAYDVNGMLHDPYFSTARPLLQHTSTVFWEEYP